VTTTPGQDSVILVEGVSKTYADGPTALQDVDLEIRRGEIFALLGPNGAGKTTLIGIICGLVNPSSGRVVADGHDIVSEYRAARQAIGLVPQELSTDAFESVWDTVSFSRGLFGKAPDPAFLEGVLKDLTLWEKRDTQILKLSGGMKRRVLIAKALSHEPSILFLDEPTAGVDVELRRDMWRLVHRLRERGVTIILTTHYIEEAEEMADRVGVIHGGRLLLVEDKAVLMKRMGRKQLTLHLAEAMDELPSSLADLPLELGAEGRELVYTYDTRCEGDPGIDELLHRIHELGLAYRDLESRASSLEEIFVELVQQAEGGEAE
jgi:ABC-2 type transport system ATP-binding protein